jgi:hypothetical protein
MKKTYFILFAFTVNTFYSFSQNTIIKPAKVDYDAYENLVAEVKEHRKNRLLDLNAFLKTSREKNVIILDTRSDEMYNSKHIKGAVHLNFSDFTQANLDRLLLSKDTKILIYCNNNIDDDQIMFATKAVVFPPPSTKKLTLALNIPTYINLYGYGYKNVYELSELVSVFDKRITFEGTSIFK